jgi:hypothetical protein
MTALTGIPTRKNALPELLHSSSLDERSGPAVGRSRLAWGLMIGCWIIQAVGNLQFVVPDGISYIEIAQSVRQGSVGDLIHGYWSPLYPTLIAGWLALLRPSMHYEILAVNCLNVVLLVMALWSFEYFVAGMVLF